MAEKHSKWTFSGNTLSLGDKTTTVRASLNMTEVWDGFDGLKEWQKFLIVYGSKQNLQDEYASTKGGAKVDEMVKDLTPAFFQALTFTRSGGKGGISYKAKLEEGMKTMKDKDVELLKTLLVKAGMGGLLK